jgi:hypothetical protein
MALFGNVSEDYTKTGKGGLTGFANKLSLIPGIRSLGNFFTNIPFIGNTFGAMIGYIDTAWEAARWLFQGKIGSAATVLAAGVVGNTVNAVSWWSVNALSGVTTGATIGTHARAATETIIGALGMHPEVLSSYPAAIGSINSSVNMGGKDNFRDKIAAERGMTRQQMDARADQAYVNQTQGNNALGA